MDWLHWFERWEAMQAAYLPQRHHRFDLIALLSSFPREASLRILDLGCGPGSVTFALLQHYPNVRVVAVDADPVLLALGRGVAERVTNSESRIMNHESADRRISGAAEQQITNDESRMANHVSRFTLHVSRDSIEFVEADLREGAWWAGYDGAFDLAVSATALHWLTGAHLAEVYRRVFCALKPGGWFFNADHIAADDPATQARYRDLLHGWQQANFAAGAEDWDGFWSGFAAELAQAGIPAQREEITHWEGSDDGLPRQFHLDTLRACGFVDVAVHWQELGEALVGARKQRSG
ncbi:MAG: class I SAM-dependent methyltransferase [Anaerolineae bacterium]|nr:class I SAM-dependent methyltransferase [Anaerolineae bacterium]